MKDVKSTCRIALVQAEPVMFDKAAGLEKVLRYIDEAAAQKHRGIVLKRYKAVAPYVRAPGKVEKTSVFNKGGLFGFIAVRCSLRGRLCILRGRERFSLHGLDRADGGKAAESCLHQTVTLI